MSKTWNSESGGQDVEALAGATVVLAEPIGQGGMGVVHRGIQPALQREVAVKRALAPTGELQLVREALVTGGLEHPNVVPVHGLERRPEGALMVMKRIRGRRWSELLRSDGDATTAARGRDLLAYHVGIFLAVCDAVAFAHDRGILHRDVKPDNVMVGAFGEVVLLDWGLAVALQEDGRGIPLARDVRVVAGTPDYLAPEQARGDGAALGPWTDVWLLGAVLYELLAGTPPHAGDTPEAKLASALERTVPALGAHLPDELRGVVAKALAPAPEDRYPDAAALRDAVRRWLDTRGADTLVVAATARLERLRRGVARAVGGEDVAAEVHALLAEARFGFRQALEVRPGHPAAQGGLGEALELGIRHELHRRNPAAAELLLGEHPAPPEALAREVKLLVLAQRRQSAEVRELRARVDALDPRRGAVGRALIFVALGLAIGLVCGALAFLEWATGGLAYWQVLAGVVAFDVLMTVALLLHTYSGKSLGLRNAGIALGVAINLHWLGAFVRDLPIHQAVAWNALLSFGLIAISAALDAALLPAALPYGLAFVLCVAAPDLAMLWFAFGNAGSFITYAVFSAAADLRRGSGPER